MYPRTRASLRSVARTSRAGGTTGVPGHAEAATFERARQASRVPARGVPSGMKSSDIFAPGRQGAAVRELKSDDPSHSPAAASQAASGRQQANVKNDSPRPSAPAAAPPRDVAARAAELESLQREIALRDDILALAAHELRNPLHALSLHLALARAAAQAGHAPDAAERIRRAELTLKRYSERVTVLMELLASPGAVYPLAPRHVNVPALLAALAESLDQEARSRGMAVAVRCVDAAADFDRHVDPVALEQVVDNLLLNAFKHSGASAVTIRLAAQADSWTIEVEDNGRGIALEDQRTIFEKFAVAAQSSRGEGTGLGLWIVTRLVRAMHGDIAVTSAPGAGALFTVRIPAGDDRGDSR
jgi:two-component system OmpR family sensor kinase